MSYEVDLEVFSGPFDLLLHLIAKRKVDVWEVDVAEITADFVASLDRVDELDLDTATSFLVVAAALLALKSSRLLPAEERTDEHEDALADARDLLYARLLEYRAFRAAAAVVEDRLEANARFVARAVGVEPRFRRLVPDTPLGVSAEGLARLAAAATAPRPDPEVDLHHLHAAALTVHEASDIVLQRLPATGAQTQFNELAAGRPLGDRVALFLALLELCKSGELVLEQPSWEAPLACRRAAPAAAAHAGLP